MTKSKKEDIKNEVVKEEVINAKPKLSVNGRELKIKAINDSNLPDWQKEKYIDSLQEKTDEVGISFEVYTKIKEIPDTIAAGMKVFPGALKTKIVTKEVWDKIFSDF